MTTKTKKKKGTGQFYFKMKQSLSSKNKLDEEIKNFLWSLDGTLIQNPTDLGFFSDLLKDRVKEIHENNSRCQAITMKIWKVPYNENEDLSVACGCSSATIYSIKQNFMQP